MMRLGKKSFIIGQLVYVHLNGAIYKENAFVGWAEELSM